MDLDDLLTPELTEADDLAGFRSPWRPGAVALGGFFGGPLIGAALVAWSFDRLGWRRRAILWAVVFLAWIALVALAALLLVRSGSLPEDLDADAFGSAAGMVLLAGYLALMLGALHTQRRRFRTYVGSGGEPGRLLPWGIGAYVLGELLRAALAELPLERIAGGGA